MADIAFLKTPSRISLTGNNMLFRIAGKNAFTSGILQKFYRLNLLPNSYENLASIDLPVSAPTTTDILPNDWTRANAGVAEIDINYLFQEDIRGHFTFPEPDSGLNFKHELLKTFTLDVGEKYGIPSELGDTEMSDVFYYFQGKLSNFRQGNANYLGKTFFDFLQDSQTFLSLAPTTKITDIYCPERLYFLFLKAGIYKFYSKQYFTDNTSETTCHCTFTADQFSILELLCSYYKLRISNKKLVKYDVWITDDNLDHVSEIRTFVLDYKFQKWARYFLFKNSFGVYEILRTIGKVLKNRDISKVFANIPLPNNFTHLDRTEKQTDVSVQTAYTIDFGFLPDKYIAEWTQEFLISNDVYWLKSGAAYPVSVQNSKNLVSKDDDYNPTGAFEITHALIDDFTEESVTNQPILIGDFNPDFNTDFFIGNIIYKNQALSVNFTKNNCGSNYSGSVVPFAVAAGKYSSSISQADADAKAMAEINAEGQSNANIAGTCIPNNIINPLTVSIIHTDVTINGAYDGTALAQPMGGVAPYTYRWIDGDTNQMRFNLAAGVYLCMVTDSVGTLATAQVTIDQPAVTFWNTYKEGSYRKNDCGSGKMGSVVIYQVAAHTFSSTISQADADAKAVADIEANGQAFANNTGTCTSIATGTLTIINNVIGNWTLSVAHGYKAPYNITNASSSPATVDVMSAYVTFSGPASYVLFNGSSIPKDTPCLVTFLSRNFLTIN